MSLPFNMDILQLRNKAIDRTNVRIRSKLLLAFINLYVLTKCPVRVCHECLQVPRTCVLCDDVKFATRHGMASCVS